MRIPYLFPKRFPENALAYVKEQMGHHSIQVTVDIYGHLVPGGNRQAVDKLDDLQPQVPEATIRNHSQEPRFVRRARRLRTQDNLRLCLFLFVKGFDCLGTCPFHVVAVAIGHLFEKSRNVLRRVQGQHLLDFARDPGLPARQ